MTHTCRLLTASDVDAFRALRLRGLKEEPRAFLDDYDNAATWPRERFEKWFDNGWIAGGFIGEELMAIAGLYRKRGRKIEHKGMVWGVYVAPEARGRGLARRLIELLLAEAKQAGIELAHISTDITNPVTNALYESLGFEPWGVEKHILKMPDGSYVNDVVMIKFL